MVLLPLAAHEPTPQQQRVNAAATPSRVNPSALISAHRCIVAAEPVRLNPRSFCGSPCCWCEPLRCCESLRGLSAPPSSLLTMAPPMLIEASLAQPSRGVALPLPLRGFSPLPCGPAGTLDRSLITRLGARSSTSLSGLLSRSELRCDIDARCGVERSAPSCANTRPHIYAGVMPHARNPTPWMCVRHRPCPVN